MMTETRVMRVLVVDDEIGIRDLLSEILTEEGYDGHAAGNAEEARRYRAFEARRSCCEL